MSRIECRPSLNKRGWFETDSTFLQHLKRRFICVWSWFCAISGVKLPAAIIWGVQLIHWHWNLDAGTESQSFSSSAFCRTGSPSPPRLPHRVHRKWSLRTRRHHRRAMRYVTCSHWSRGLCKISATMMWLMAWPLICHDLFLVGLHGAIFTMAVECGMAVVHSQFFVRWKAKMCTIGPHQLHACIIF